MGFLNFKVTNFEEITDLPNSKHSLLLNQFSFFLVEDLTGDRLKEMLGSISGKLTFKHYPLKFLHLNEMVSDYRSELPRMIEK